MTLEKKKLKESKVTLLDLPHRASSQELPTVKDSIGILHQGPYERIDNLIWLDRGTMEHLMQFLHNLSSAVL